MKSYQPSFVIADDNTVIALRFVESMNLARDGEDLVVDKLKGDVVIDICTQGGKSYTISALKQAKISGKQYNMPDDPHEMRVAIFERWISFIN